MKVFNGIALRHLFTVICIIGVTCMVGYWIYKFGVEDRDIGVVDYKPLEDIPDTEVPVPTLCFRNPFLPDRLSEITRYLEYMYGDGFRNESGHIDYGNVTLNLNDHFLFSKVEWRNGSVATYGSTHILHKDLFNGGFGPSFFKCFQISTNIQGRGKMERTYFYYKQNEIMNDLQKYSAIKYYINIYYPGQFLLTPGDLQVSFIKQDNNSLIVWVNDIEILKSRNSRNRQCTAIEDTDSFDDMVLEKHIGINGCRAPYLKPVTGYPLCDTPEKIKKCTYTYQDVRKKYYASACQRLSKVRLGLQYYDTYRKHTHGILPTDVFAVGFKYPEYAKIITQSKEVDIHGLVGNIGGYIGLFLGNNIPFI